jgi:hypothetical protein
LIPVIPQNIPSNILNIPAILQDRSSKVFIKNIMEEQETVRAMLLLWTGKAYKHPQLVQFVKETIDLVSKHITKDTLYTALYFVDKISRRYGDKHPGTEYSAFLVGLMIADGFIYDNPYSLSSWAHVSKLKKIDVKAMRRKVLVLLDHNVYISREDYNEWILYVDLMLEMDALH